MAVDVLCNFALRREGGGQDESDVVLLHYVRGSVADLGLQAGIGGGREAPQRAEVGRRLTRVTHPELDVVDALERQEVLRFLVGVLVEVRTALVDRALVGASEG